MPPPVPPPCDADHTFRTIQNDSDCRGSARNSFASAQKIVIGRPARSCHRPNVELAVIEQREFELPADSADIGLRKE